MMTLEQLLLSLGINIWASAIYDVVKKYFEENSSPSIAGLKEEISSSLEIDWADIKAENIIELLAQNWNIQISGSSIFAPNSISMWSTTWNQFTFWNNSISRTNHSSIEAWYGATIIWSWNTRIEQSSDWSIKFYV